MKTSVFAAVAIGLAFLPVVDSVYAQSLYPKAPNYHSETRTLPTPQVCFYTAPDFKGLFFCEAGTRTVATVPSQWRSKIKSLTISDNTAVQICSANVLQGTCDLIDRNTKKLEPGLFNHVYSYDIRQTY